LYGLILIKINGMYCSVNLQHLFFYLNFYTITVPALKFVSYMLYKVFLGRQIGTGTLVNEAF
jgi:hypothetical protein